jgi:8-oxo-dGTP diphosphatase
MLKVTCAIIVKQNKILVTQRGGNTDHPFQWEFPGGKINQNETAADCIAREINEELGIEIRILDLIIPVQHDYGFRKIELIPFICEIHSGSIKLTEHIFCKWISFEELFNTDFSEADKKLILLTENQKKLKKYLGENKNDSG